MKYYILLLLVIIILWIINFNFKNKNKFTINKHKFKIYTKFITKKEIRNGLMFKKEKLPDNSAALFIFEYPQKVSFWMKNTFISLDLIYLDSEYKVIYLYENTIPKSLTSHIGYDVKYVLEVNAGTIKNKQIRINDIIVLN